MIKCSCECSQKSRFYSGPFVRLQSASSPITAIRALSALCVRQPFLRPGHSGSLNTSAVSSPRSRLPRYTHAYVFREYDHHVAYTRTCSRVSSPRSSSTRALKSFCFWTGCCSLCHCKLFCLPRF